MPRLTEQEQQEIILYIEADKPLPDKFRFLLFEDKREVELLWNGKTSEVSNIVLPFQVIEQVDEPRADKPEDTKAQLSMFDTRGRQIKGWTNKLIWGDNKLILSSLKNGPLREEIEAQGSLPDIFQSLNCNIESHRNRIVFTQQVVKQSQSELEQTEVTAVAPMDNPDPTVLLTQRTEIDDPDVG